MVYASLNENRLGILIWQTSNIWQSKLRKILKKFDISLNEYLIIEALYKLKQSNHPISQINLAKNSSIDVSVVSIKISLLVKKKIIERHQIDNRSNKINLTNYGLSLVSSLIETIQDEEIDFFNKLGDDTFNLKNSLKLLLGKKIRIKANKTNV